MTIFPYEKLGDRKGTPLRFLHKRMLLRFLPRVHRYAFHVMGRCYASYEEHTPTPVILGNAPRAVALARGPFSGLVVVETTSAFAP